MWRILDFLLYTLLSRIFVDFKPFLIKTAMFCFDFLHFQSVVIRLGILKCTCLWNPGTAGAGGGGGGGGGGGQGIS